MRRQNTIMTGEIYHVMNKSIAGFQIFNHPHDYEYMLQALSFFSLAELPCKLSHFKKRDQRVQRDGFDVVVNQLVKQRGQIVQSLAYCLMPTHIHILIKQTAEHGLVSLMCNVLNSYARYFNTKYNRRGPLWMGPFKNVPVTNDEQLLHVSRYIHLNPVTAGLVRKAEDWPYSSYDDFCESSDRNTSTANFAMSGAEYAKFCVDLVDYQRELETIRNEILE